MHRCSPCGCTSRETMINAYVGRERPRGWSFLAHHWELIIVSLAEEVRIRLCVRLRKAMERATDICLDIRDEPADLRESDALS